MPQMGVSVTEGTVVDWHKQVGDEVARDETICEISTDKIDTEVPVAGGRRAWPRSSSRSARRSTSARCWRGSGRGRPASRTRPGGADGDRRRGPARPGDAGAEPPRPASAARRDGRPPLLARSCRASPPSTTSTSTGQGHGPRRARAQAGRARVPRAATATARAAAAHRVAVSHDRAAPSRHRPRAHAGAAPAGEPLSRMRRVDRRAHEALAGDAAHCTTIVECDMSGVERRRRELGVTALPIVARAASTRCASSRRSTRRWRATTFTRHEARPPRHRRVAGRRRPDRAGHPRRPGALAPRGSAQRIKDLARAGARRKLTPDDVAGGTFTITNPGAFGRDHRDADHQPAAGGDPRPRGRRQAAGRGHRRRRHDRSPSARWPTSACRWDHRAIDGAYAARFLTAVRKRIEGI